MSDRGSAPIELAAGLGLLVLPIALIVLIAPTWVGAKSAAETAAMSAARAIATGSGTVASEEWALALVDETARVRGFEEVTATACPGVGTCLPLQRDKPIDVAVTLRAPALSVPGIGSIGGFWVSASAATRVDPYRSVP